MAAYIYTILRELDPQGFINIPEGQMVCIPLNITSQLHLTTIHTVPVQDFSIRCWLSEYPGGPSIDPRAPVIGYWNPQRVVLNGFSYLTPGTTSSINEPVPFYQQIVKPGSYHLNLLNLINEPNQLAIKFLP